MDIYSYIRDGEYKGEQVAEYCKKLGQTWTPFEMALIIGKSERPIAEKHSVWHELMEKYPDMPTFANRRHPVYESYCDKLNEYIAYQEKLYALFMKPEPGTYYTCRVNLIYRRPKADEDNLPLRTREYRKLKTEFPTFEDAWENAKPLYSSHLTDDNPMKVDDICVAKVYDAKNNVKLYADFDTDANCYDVNIWEYTKKKPIFNFDRSIEHMFGREFYVFIPTTWGKMGVLNEKERMLFYKVLLILEKWDPMGLADIGSITEYSVETYKMLKFLLKGAGEQEIYDYLRDKYVSSWSFGINKKKMKWFEQTYKEPLLELLSLSTD